MLLDSRESKAERWPAALGPRAYFFPASAALRASSYSPFLFRWMMN
jgi:hypothetical protein